MIERLRRPSLLALCVALAGGCGRTHPAPAPSTAPPPVVHRAPTPLKVAETVYDGKLGPGWDDWGWGPHTLTAGQPALIGLGGFGGWIIHHDEMPSAFGGLAFRFKAPESYGDFLEVSLEYRQVDEKVLPPVFVDAHYIAELADGWREALIPWSELNPSGSPFDRIQIHAKKLIPGDPVAFDKVVLTAPVPGQAAPAGSAAASSPKQTVSLVVECDKPAKPISPLIYGFSGDDFSNGATAHRMGGNTTTRLNWDIGNVWNTGADWYFENVSGPNGSTVYAGIEAIARRGAKNAVTVPIIGWVAKDATSCGFPVSVLGPQRAQDPYRKNCGDGHTADGKPIQPGPPTQTSIPAPPELIAKWIQKVRDLDAKLGKRSVDEYILDNEPGIWNTTHRDVHPEPLGYDELLDRTIRYGSVIRKVDPGAVIAGPAEWGWSGYFYSAKDLAGRALHTDRLMHGNTPLIPWYLKKLAEHEKQTGERVLDVLDVHYYPQAPNIYGGNAGTDRSTAALRIRSTRSLWDPSYTDESWINDRVNLIPRLKQWVAENYPGRKVSLGEWNFGAEEHISGGLATAEALGRFGQQGLDSAYWWGSKSGTPAYAAFRAFRNYDGKGAHFLDYSIPTREAPKLSMFASRDQSGSHIVIILLNLDADAAVHTNVDVARCGDVTARRVFGYGQGSLQFMPEPATGDDAHVASQDMPPYSMKVVELTLANPKPR